MSLMHRTIKIVLVAWWLVVSSVSFADEPCGYLERIEHQDILHVYGTHYDMGYASGYLLAPRIRYLIDHYILLLIDPYTYEHTVMPIFQAAFELDPQVMEELEGMLQGMVDSGVSLYIPQLARDFTVLDAALLNALPDLGQLAGLHTIQCSSISSWGEGTLTDPVLAGDPIVARNLDWWDTQFILASSTLIVAYWPSTPDEQPWVAITFPGFIGALSGLNEAGVTASLNMGNVVYFPTSGGCTPICLTIRKGLEKRDFDADGLSTPQDVAAAIQQSTRAGAYIVHSINSGAESQAAVQVVNEANYRHYSGRVPADEPALDPIFLIATNHFRKIAPPTSCSRYALLYDAVVEDRTLPSSKAWQLLGSVSLSTNTIYSFLFYPAQREIFVAYTDSLGIAPQKTPVHLTWNQLFPFTPSPHPTLSPTPTGTSIPATATPQASATATNQPTPPAEDRIGVALTLNADWFHNGDRFLLDVGVASRINADLGVDHYLILDVYGTYFFWPEWLETVDYQRVVVPAWSETHETILDFIWPQDAGAGSELKFWSGMLEAGTLDLASNIVVVTFGFQS